MRVAGIDVSSKSIDIVTIPLDDPPPYEPGTIDGPIDIRYVRIELEGADAIDRAARAASQIPVGLFWDELCRVAIERPFAGVAGGAHSVMVAHLVIGAIIGAMPERLRPPILIQPRSWRKKNGLPVDASKKDVRAFVIREHAGIRRDLEQDAYDAVCIARAARTVALEELQAQTELAI